MNATTAKEKKLDLFTITEIAREAGVTERQADYAARSYRVEPARRIGIVRVFDAAGAEQVKSAIRRIADRMEASRG